ncbi:hypothetical protein IAT38_005596 [Cryptococcus sp. DSM 104549]
MAATTRFLSSARLARPSLTASKQPVMAARRGYASPAPAVGGPNWLLLGGAGVALIAGTLYASPQLKDAVYARLGLLEKNAEAKIKSAEAQKDAVERASGSISALIKDSWVPFTIEKIEKYNHNTNIYHFNFGEEHKDKTSGGEVASVVLIRSPEGEGELKDDKGKPIIRPYTPVSPPDQKGSLELMIKEYPGGKITPWLAGLSPGAKVLFKGPLQKFKYEPNSFDRGLCVAGGSGITPMWQLITHSLTIPEDKTKWTLVFANVTEKDILLRKEWDALAAAHPDRLQVKYVLDKAPWGWSGESGYVTPELISKVFPRKPEEKVRAFVCGPPGQMKAVSGAKDGMKQGELSGALKELGYTSEEVFKY